MAATGPTMRILTEQQERLRAELRSALGRLDEVLSRIGASAEDRRLLADALRNLSELFLLVVVGEFNAGKSALLNELLGSRILAEGVTPTTAAITLVRYGERESDEWHGEAFLERRLAAPVLRDLAVVDTPGTNAIIRRHDELTRNFVPRADLVLFVTSADRPFTESERELLENIRAWGKKVVVVVNKVDLLESAQAVEQVIEFVRGGLRSTLGIAPPIFPTSVRLARTAVELSDQAVSRALAAAGGLDDLRRYVFGTLDEEARLRLKLATPLGVAEALIDRSNRAVDERLQALAGDIAMIENVEGQIGIHADDLRAGFAPRLAEIENVIHELNDRGEGFFEETVRIGRVLDLLSPDRTRGAFEREVIGETGAEVDRIVHGTVDWFVESEARLWRDVSGMVRQRQQTLTGSSDDPDFLAARREVLQSIAQRTRDALAGFDREAESREVGESLRDAVAQTALAEIGAVSLGTAIAVLFGTVAADVTGLLAATLLATLGLYILPARKKRALSEFRERTEGLRARLVKALETQLEREVAGSTGRVREAIAPYTRYVRAESGRLTEQRTALFEVGERVGRLRAEIGAVGDRA
jgi:small GTP-binding protein